MEHLACLSMRHNGKRSGLAEIKNVVTDLPILRQRYLERRRHRRALHGWPHEADQHGFGHADGAAHLHQLCPYGSLCRRANGVAVSAMLRPASLTQV